MTPVLLDTIVGIVILLSALIAFFRGFIKEVLTVVNLLGATAAAWILGPHLLPFYTDLLAPDANAPVKHAAAKNADYIMGFVPPAIAANFLAHATAFFGVFLILMLAGMAISSTVKAMGLGMADRILGMVFGALRGFIIVFLIYFPFAYFQSPDKLPDWARDSVSVTALNKFYTWGDDYLKKRKEDHKDDPAEPVDPNSWQGKLDKMTTDTEGAAKSAVQEGKDKATDILPAEDKSEPK